MKFVGSSQPIHDARGKVTGKTRYAGDMQLPGMAHVCLVASTVPHGYIRAVNAEKALALEGVLGVFHCFNTTERTFNRYRSRAGQPVPQEERVFQSYVRYVGDRVAAVAAVDQETARRAARLVEVTYEELPSAVGFDDALAGKNCLAGETAVRDDFSAELGQAPSQEGLVAVESFTEFPRLHHAAMEPHVCVVDYDAGQEALTIYSPNQAVFGIRTVVADLLELPYHRVRVVKSTMGGSFGAKQEWVLEPVAALIALRLRRPVKLVLSREEVMVSTIVRTPMRAALKGLFTPDGKLMSLELDLLSDAGAYIGNSSDYIRTLYGKLFRCYRIPHVRYRARVVSSNTPVSGAYRGWSAPEEALILEHFLDDAAGKLGLDAVELRLRNVLLPGEHDLKSGLPLEEIRIRQALEEGCGAFHWAEKKQADQAFNAENPRYRRGVGVGCGGHGNTYYPRYGDFARAELRLNEDGTLRGNLTIHDHGCGTVTAFRLILAEALDMDPANIQLNEADSAVSPFDYGCFSSRTTFVVGRAAYEAAMNLRKTLLESAAALHDLPVEELYLRDGGVASTRQPELFFSFGQLSLDSITTLRRELTAAADYQETSNPGVTGAHFAHVEVDTYTGFTKVLDYLAVHDIGTPVNPGMCIAQIQGAVQMGCGAALREKLVVGPDGRCTDSLSKYHLFLACDLPDIQVRLICDGTSAEGPYGAKSIGEVCYVPVAPAVCGAVNQALGSHLGQLPLDPDCILKYLAKERQA